MARQMLKLRKGDSAIMIRKDGSVQLAGCDDKPLMDEKGMMSPVILFAAAWAKKDQNLIAHMVDNFKNCVREGYFGPEAQSDFKEIEVEAEKNRLEKERAAASGTVTTQAASGTVTTEQPKIVPNISKEDFDKHKEEEKRLEAIAEQGQDPRVKKQMEAMKAGATKVETKPFEGHLLKDDDDEQQVGTVTIEEGEENNENQ